MGGAVACNASGARSLRYGATRPEAALVGNLVASVTVRQLATTGTASPAELIPALALWKEQNA